jgi:lipopolysaccharide transport system ATP-binding protein
MSTIISVENISKLYHIGARQKHGGSLRESLGKLLKGQLSFKTNGHTNEEDLWALKDVSFEVGQGEVVGLIGRNGAGKSTLLKILSRITEPTSGRIRLYGRVGSLLEVGTGFHPELTGRENILLNGAILGMSRAEIERKFDQIVAFSEIEKFIETPVKFYSSGMYVRLAFSVAVHMEPEILLVDEVLSVGDMAFQRKCLDKINSMKEQTKAIILVSHSMISVKAICSRVLFMDGGTVAANGDPKEIIPYYEKVMLKTVEANKVRDEAEHGEGSIQIQSVKLFGPTGNEQTDFEIGEKLRVVVEYDAIQRLEHVVAYAAIRRPDGFICVGTSTQLENIALPPLEGPGSIEIEVPELLVMPGHYVMDVCFYDQNFKHRAYFFGRKKAEFVARSSTRALDEMYGVLYQEMKWGISGVKENPTV